MEAPSNLVNPSRIKKGFESMEYLAIQLTGITLRKFVTTGTTMNCMMVNAPDGRVRYPASRDMHLADHQKK